MKGTITKIHELKASRNGNAFRRVDFKLEDGSFAMTDLCPNFRNYKRWEKILSVGVDLEGLELKSPNKVNADSFPKPYRTPVKGRWIQNEKGAMEFIPEIPIKELEESLPPAGFQQTLI